MPEKEKKSISFSLKSKPVYCELHQNHDKIDFVENIEGIDEWPHQAPEGEISYRLNNFSDDLSKAWQTRAVTVALRAWKLRLDRISFRRERNPDAHVYANIEWNDLAHFDNRKGVLAHGYFPGQGEASGDVHLNDEWDYVAGVKWSDPAHPPLVPILMHEFGHSIIGLRHDTNSIAQGTEIMYPSFDLGKKFYKLGPRTIQRGQDRYGARTLNQRIIDYFLLRRFRGSDFR